MTLGAPKPLRCAPRAPRWRQSGSFVLGLRPTRFNSAFPLRAAAGARGTALRGVLDEAGSFRRPRDGNPTSGPLVTARRLIHFPTPPLPPAPGPTQLAEYDRAQVSRAVTAARRQRLREERYKDLESTVAAGRLVEESVDETLRVHDLAEAAKRRRLHEEWSKQVHEPLRSSGVFMLTAEVRPPPSNAFRPQ